MRAEVKIVSWQTHVVATALIFASLFAFPFSTSIAATAVGSSLEARRQAIFEQILRDPANLDLSFEYAALSTQAGDFEGAITAMERMLIFAPGLPRIQLELGVLYFRLGSFAVARNYLELAISGNNVPDVVRQRVAAYLSRIENSQKRHKFSGSFLSGVRYQSNANSGPSSANIRLNGVGFTLNNQSVEKADVNAFVAGTFHYDYDLHRQGDLFEVDTLFYGAKFRDVTTLDTAVVEVTFGPSFNLQRYDIRNTQLGVYGIANVVGLGSDFYLGTLGLGTHISHHTDAGGRFKAKAEYRQKWYNNTASRLTVTDRDGYQLVGEVSYSTPLSPKLLAHGMVRGERENVDTSYNDYYQIGAELGATATLASPFSKSGIFNQSMFLDITGGYRYSVYDAPDATINAAERQKKNELYARATLTIPIADNMTIVPQVEYRDHNSNYDIYKFSGWSAYVALGKRF